MNTLLDGHFISPTKGQVSVDEMVSSISEFVKEDPAKFYRLVIGTDSQARSVDKKHEIDYVTAIIIHRTGRGAKYFWKKQKEYKVPHLSDKSCTETLMSLA